MPILQYSIEVVGMQNVSRALSTIEARWTQHARRVVASANRMPVARGAASPAQAKREADGLAKSFTGIAAAAKVQQEETRRLARENRGLADSFKAISRAAQQAERAQVSAARRAQQDFRRRTGRVVSGVGSAIGSVGATALGVVGLGGGALIASRLGPAATLEKQQRGLVVAGSGQMNYEQVRGLVKNTSLATGVGQEDVTAGLREYVSATGDLTGAAKQINMFATTATAAEANVTDVAKAAAYLSKNMNISADEMPKALATLYFQGKKGAFELKDIAEAVPMLGAQAQTLGVTGLSGVKTLGGLAQIAQTGTGNPAEAQTALSNLFTQIVAKAGKLQSGEAFGGHGVSVFQGNDPTKPMKDIRTVLADMIAASRGNVTELEKFGEIRGSRALNPLVAAYRGASGGGAKPEQIAAGRNAVLKMIADNADAVGTFKDVVSDAGEVQKSASIELAKIETQLTDEAQRTLLPALVKLGPGVERLIPIVARVVEKFAGFVDWASANPWAGLSTILGAALVKEVGSGVIGPMVADALKNTISNLIASLRGGGAPGGVPLPGVPGAPTSGLGKGLAIAGAAIPAAMALYEVGKQSFGLTRDIQHTGGLGATFDLVRKGPAKATTREEYDRLYGTAPRGGTPAAMAPKELVQAGQDLRMAAADLRKATHGLNRSNTPSPVK